jgi:uncharacterized protein DUF1828
MNVESIKEQFRRSTNEQVELRPLGDGRFLVVTPFRFDDGDHFVIVLKQEEGNWILTDEATTLMHLSYQMDENDIETGNRAELIENSISTFSVQNRRGELVSPVYDEKFGDSLYNFIQALGKVSDVSFLSREIVRSTFLEDFRAFMRAKVPADRLLFDWTDFENDTKQKYPVDARVNHRRHPLFVFALPNDDRVQLATICIHMFERWKIPFTSLGIFEDQEVIARRPLARFTDVCNRTFSSLRDNEDRISSFLDRILKTDD